MKKKCMLPGRCNAARQAGLSGCWLVVAEAQHQSTSKRKLRERSGSTVCTRKWQWGHTADPTLLVPLRRGAYLPRCAIEPEKHGRMCVLVSHWS